MYYLNTPANRREPIVVTGLLAKYQPPDPGLEPRTVNRSDDPNTDVLALLSSEMVLGKYQEVDAVVQPASSWNIARTHDGVSRGELRFGRECGISLVKTNPVHRAEERGLSSCYFAGWLAAVLIAAIAPYQSSFLSQRVVANWGPADTITAAVLMLPGQNCSAVR